MSDVKVMFEESLVEQNRGNLAQAIEKLTQILILKPDMPAAWNNRASMIAKLGSPFDAIMNYNKAIELDPVIAAPYNNRGASYYDLNLFEEAVKDYQKASDLAPNYPEPFNNKGNALMRLGKIEEATHAYRSAIALRPNYHDAHIGLSLSLLKLERYEEGWKEFEHRWNHSSLPARGLPYHEWKGERAESPDDALLLYGEQGFGDIIQFMRWAPIAKPAWGGKVYVETKPPLERLTKTMKGIDGTVVFGEKPPHDVKYCAPLMSVPNTLKFYDIPDQVPYVSVDPYKVNIWRERLKALPEKFVIGVCWAGMNRTGDPGAAAIDKRRSVTLKSFAPVAQIPGVSWASLQVGPPSEQVKDPPPGMSIGAWGEDLYDFSDTGALMEACDLIITVDTAVCHVAGALGRPTWLLNRFDGCWRWLHGKEDTKWYPSMRIFTQPSEGDWDDVMNQMAVALRRHVLTYNREAA